MNRRTIVVVMCLSLLAAPATALAGGSGHHGYRSHHHHGAYGYGHRGYRQSGSYYGAGLLAGAVVLGALLSRPAYQRPPRVVYVQPVPRGPCVLDQVVRTLPDGRIQTGTRTRCY